MKLTLEFDNQEAANNFISWWLDGGGEQYLNFDTSTWNLKSGYLRIEGIGKPNLDNLEE
jgi:hypothetical protein